MRKIILHYTLFLLLFLGVNSAFAKILLVNPNGNGGNRLTTVISNDWNNHAFVNLQMALDSAQYQDEIWVKAGTYYPTETYNKDTIILDYRERTFRIHYGIYLYGGFNATETSLNQRDWKHNATILSGDFSNNDIISGDGATLSISGNGENAYWVVSAVDGGNLDGFCITGANQGINGGAGILVWDSFTITNSIIKANVGGGLYSGLSSLSFNFGTSFEISNVIFEKNIAFRGAALHVDWMPTVKNCIFEGNLATNSGSAIYNGGQNNNGYTNCTFVNNHAGLKYRTIHNEDLSPVFKNSIFYANTGDILPVDVNFYAPAYSHCLVDINPHFVNISDPDGADNIWLTADDGLQLACNSTAINTGANTDAPLLDILGNSLYPTNGNKDIGAYEKQDFPIVPLISIGTSSIVTTQNSSVSFLATVTNGGTNPNFQWKLNGNNVGTNSLNYTLTNPNHHDVISCTMFANNVCQTKDTLLSNSLQLIVTSSLNRIYVNPSASGTNNGTSWANAFSNLQFALTYPGITANTEIWVASGTYKDYNNAQTGTFNIPNGVAIYGGFNGTETSLSERDFVNNVTILSGDFVGNDFITGSADSLNIENNTENVFHVLTANGLTLPTRLDGFTIVGGSAGVYSSYLGITAGNASGGGFFNIGGGTNLTLANLIFNGNFASNNGGAIANFNGASPNMINITFNQNRSGNSGAAISNQNGSNPNISNCTFTGNTGFWNGGAIANDASNPIINTCIFTSNFAVNYGGAIANMNNSSASISNCNFSQNIALQNGGAIYNESSNTSIIGSIFNNANTASYGGAIYNLNASPNISNSIFTNNQATSNGGALANINGTPLITNCQFVSNNGAYGGAMYNYSSTPLISKSLFNANTATVGAGIMNEIASPTILNCVFSSNNANFGTSIANQNGTNTTVLNTTFSENTASNSKFILNENSTITLHNSIVWGTVGYNNQSIQNNGTGNATVMNSLIQGAGASGTNLDTNPLFVNIDDADGLDDMWLTEDDGLRLASVSPCINSGNNSNVSTTDDIRGATRIQDYTVDMGAYEGGVTLSCIFPTAFIVGGGGFVCAGTTTGVSVGLIGSEINVSYQLQNDGNNIGSPILGTGMAINFTNLTMAGLYTIVGTNINEGCTMQMVGNTSIFIDNNPPSFDASTVPANVTLSCIDVVPSAATVLATSSCAAISFKETTTKSVNSSLCAFYNYKITRTWTATDKLNRKTTVQQIITVKDNNAPTVTDIPDNITVAPTGIPIVVTPTVSDNCSPVANITTNFTENNVVYTNNPCYNYHAIITRTWKIQDVCKLTTTKTQKITVIDVPLTCPSDKTLNTNSNGKTDYNCSTTALLTDSIVATTANGCTLSSLKYQLSGATTGTGNGAVNKVLNIGETMITYTLLSASTCNFKVTVLDNEAPKITPTSYTIDDCAFPTVWSSALNPTVNDNCDATPTLELMSEVIADVVDCNLKSAALKYTKSNTRTWKATDNKGNTATATQIIYLRDKQVPTALCKNVTTIISTASVTINAASFDNGSSDNCSMITLGICRGATCTSSATTLILSKMLIPNGQNQIDLPINLRVKDACANISTCAATLTLSKISTMGKSNNTTTLAVDDSNIGLMEVEPSLVESKHGVLRIFPNPFSGELNIQFNLTKTAEKTTLKVFDNQGRLVATNEIGTSTIGFYQMHWNLSDLSNGLYHICLEADGEVVKVEKVILAK